VILALDVTDKSRALEVVNDTAKYIDAVKVGYPLILSTGIEIIGDLKKSGKPIIADLKVADVPHVSSEICRIATSAGADYVIIQGFLGRDVVKACSNVAAVFVVCDMSHPGALDFISSQSVEIARATRSYAQGIVAPATRPESIRNLRGIVGNLIIIAPGIKSQGAKVGSALKAGADFEIIGRAIYNSPDPVEEAKSIYRELKMEIKNG
jgi:orotidine-5'-phosphate decarboxylase